MRPQGPTQILFLHLLTVLSTVSGGTWKYAVQNDIVVTHHIPLFHALLFPFLVDRYWWHMQHQPHVWKNNNNKNLHISFYRWMWLSAILVQPSYQRISTRTHWRLQFRSSYIWLQLRIKHWEPVQLTYLWTTGGSLISQRTSVHNETRGLSL